MLVADLVAVPKRLWQFRRALSSFNNRATLPLQQAPFSALSRSPSRFAPCASRSSPIKHVTEPADHFAGGEMSWVRALGPLRRVAQD